MNWFGFLRREGADADVPPAPAAQPTAEEIRQLFFDAIAADDEARLQQLCREHREAIARQGAAWLEVPERFRANPEVYEWLDNGLKAIARYCAEDHPNSPPLPPMSR